MKATSIAWHSLVHLTLSRWMGLRRVVQGILRPVPPRYGDKAPRRGLGESEKGEVLLRGVGTLRYRFPPNASVQWQPDGLTIRTKKSFLGAGFLGAPPISLREVPKVAFGTRAQTRSGERAFAAPLRLGGSSHAVLTLEGTKGGPKEWGS